MFDGNNYNFRKLNLSNLHYEPPRYDEDCDMVDICESIGATYKVCYKGCDMIGCDRCSIDTKQRILQQHKAEELAEQNAKTQSEENKKSTRRSWVQLILAAILGGIITKFLDWIFWVIQ